MILLLTKPCTQVARIEVQGTSYLVEGIRSSTKLLASITVTMTGDSQYESTTCARPQRGLGLTKLTKEYDPSLESWRSIQFGRSGTCRCEWTF